MITKELKGVLDCPKCGQILDTVSIPDALGNKVNPKDGDISICSSCGELLEIKQYSDEYTYIQLTDSKLKEIEKESGKDSTKLLYRIQEEVKKYIENNKE